MMFGTGVSEVDPVEVIRVSPEDAPSLVPDAAARRQKLRGTVVANFGAFLERSWRENDLLWGRLDAADRIITALLPHESSKRLRDQLIDEAQDEIIEEFDLTKRVRDAALNNAVADARSGNDARKEAIEAAVQAVSKPPANRRERGELMKIYGSLQPPEMERSRLMRAGARATEIIGRMLETMAVRKGATPKRLVTSVGRLLWGLVEISVPRSAPELLGRYWLSLALALELVLIVGGTLLNQPGAAQLGWTLLGLTAIVWFARRFIASFIKGPRPFRAFLRTAALSIVLAMCGLMFFGAVHLRDIYGEAKAAAVDTVRPVGTSLPNDGAGCPQCVIQVGAPPANTPAPPAHTLWPFIAMGTVLVLAGTVLLLSSSGVWVKAVGTAAVLAGVAGPGYLVRKIDTRDLFTVNVTTKIEIEKLIDVTLDAKLAQKLKAAGVRGPEHLGYVSAFIPGKAELPDGGGERMTVICKQWKARAKDQHALLLVIGATDRVPLVSAARAQFESNFGLARARAETVKSTLHTECGIAAEQMIALVSGPRKTPALTPAARRERGEGEDRRVDVWALWSWPGEKTEVLTSR
jgi:hypothetical protein